VVRQRVGTTADCDDGQGWMKSSGSTSNVKVRWAGTAA
jgi:hypothetical protein